MSELAAAVRWFDNAPPPLVGMGGSGWRHHSLFETACCV